jgi:uncharacterized protein (DUF58 family)
VPNIPYRYFQPTHSGELRQLELTVRGVVEGVFSGLHKSPHKGFSIEFAEHREYVPGDEIKHLDWRVLARTDRHVIKQYEQETNLRATICVDASGSMNFAGPRTDGQPQRPRKFDVACTIAASLAYLLSAQQDLVGLTVFDTAVRSELAAGNGPAHLDQLFRRLESLTPSTETDLAAALHQVANRIPRRGVVILLSDLLDDPDRLTRALQQLRHARHQVVALQILDPAELTLPGTAPLTFVDAEDGQKIQIDPRTIRTQYQTAFTSYLSDLKQRCGQAGITYLQTTTDVPAAQQVRELLRRMAG